MTFRNIGSKYKKYGLIALLLIGNIALVWVPLSIKNHNLAQTNHSLRQQMNRETVVESGVEAMEYQVLEDLRIQLQKETKLLYENVTMDQGFSYGVTGNYSREELHQLLQRVEDMPSSIALVEGSFDFTGEPSQMIFEYRRD